MIDPWSTPTGFLFYFPVAFHASPVLLRFQFPSSSLLNDDSMRRYPEASVRSQRSLGLPFIAMQGEDTGGLSREAAKWVETDMIAPDSLQ